jgi:tetratricopeptide (TPR) repeat protein
MEYESTLNQALDLLADSEERKAGRILQGCIDDIKKHLTGTDADLIRYYYWGRCLTAMAEAEQALLKFEKALRIDPDHEGSLWETASIFLHELERPENAKTLLAERLIPLHPDNADYQEALREVEFTLKLRKAPPPLTKEEADSVGDELDSEGMSDDPPGEDGPLR